MNDLNIELSTSKKWIMDNSQVNYSVFFSFVLKNKVDVSLFWEIWGHQRLPSDHKIGRKLPFGKKHHLMSFAIIQEDDGPKEEFQDEPI